MTAFDQMARTLFADPNLAADALYRAGGSGPGVAVRAIITSPDRTGNFGDGRFLSSSFVVEVQREDAPDLAIGDTFEIGGLVYTVRGDPVRDSDRRIWTAEVKEP